MEVLKSRHKENTPATGIITGLNTLVTRKKKSLEYLKCLSNGKDLFYEFWQRVIRHKIIINKHEILTAAEQVNYIINHYKGKAAAYLKADLRKGTFDGNPEHLMNFLKNCHGASCLQANNAKGQKDNWLKKEERERI